MTITQRPQASPVPSYSLGSTGSEPVAPGGNVLLIVALNAFAFLTLVGAGVGAIGVAWHVDKTGNHPYRLLGLGIFMAGLLSATLLFAFACIIRCLVHIDWNTSSVENRGHGR